LIAESPLINSRSGLTPAAAAAAAAAAAEDST